MQLSIFEMKNFFFLFANSITKTGTIKIVYVFVHCCLNRLGEQEIRIQISKLNKINNEMQLNTQQRKQK